MRYHHRQHSTTRQQLLTFSTKRGSVTSRASSSWKKYLTGLSLVTGAAAVAYDATNEFEYTGATGRFMRSVRIAATISADYLWTLHGMPEDSSEYEKVYWTINLEALKKQKKK